MAAFKAANPDAVFEDFIRWHSPGDWDSDDDDMETGWHSPGDWESGDGMETGSSQIKSTESLKVEWPPHGRLSERMSEKGNSWRNLWNEAPSIPASEQKPLLDANQEGEKILHYLETLKPHLLLEQMVSTAFRAVADTLSQTSFGNSRQMVTKIEQLYPTMALSLKYLQVPFRISGSYSIDSEVIEGLRRLCVIFGQIERLLTLAASLHRKLLQAPRLFEAIFSDCCKVYLPMMGSGSTISGNKKEFEMKQQPVNAHEREAVANMFTPPTANQSWRKVLSMGNLLNGHEPILREIIFCKRDRVSRSYYASSSQKEHLQEIETYRMYICGTSNDLRVALAIASCD
ncbi:hypothetical protein Leryth_023116 [Lithospermum erythrorhizon]|nr:hypothetical protein Leryth_023116 [Lithospermum erythrorhizon]